MYETLALLDPATSVSSDDVEAAIASRFAVDGAAAPSVSRVDERVVVSWPDFTLAIDRNALPHVVVESAEMAELLDPDHESRARVALCRERFEVSGTSDFDMEHFDAFCFVIAAMEDMGTVYTFDSGSGEFMNL
jgi:hypothetical protein